MRSNLYMFQGIPWTIYLVLTSLVSCFICIYLLFQDSVQDAYMCKFLL